MTASRARIGVWIGAFVAAWMASPTLAAQDGEREAIRRQLAASVTTFGGYDTDVTAGAVSDPRLDASGSHIGATMLMKYQTRLRKIDFTTQGDSDVRWYRAVQSLTAASFAGSAAISAEVTPRVRVSGSAHASYLPQFQFAFVPYAPGGRFDAAPPTLDRRLSRGEMVSAQTDASLTYRFTNRSAMEFTYGAGHHSLIQGNYEMTTQSFAGALSRNLTQYATLRLGYGEQFATYPLANGATSHTLRNRVIDAGVNYSRPLSETRRTTVGFGSGTASVEHAAEHFFTLTGHASLAHLISKTMRIGGLYSRGLAVVPGFSEPFFGDAVTVTAESILREKFALIASAGYSKGNVGLGPLADGYSGMEGSARVEVPIRRRQMSLFASYFYYGYSFSESVLMPFEVARGVGRHGVRAGVTLKVPLLVERTPSAPR